MRTLSTVEIQPSAYPCVPCVHGSENEGGAGQGARGGSTERDGDYTVPPPAVAPPTVREVARKTPGFASERAGASVAPKRAKPAKPESTPSLLVASAAEEQSTEVSGLQLK